jgi:hypothetical protein
MYGNADHGEEPQENPANPPEVNEKLKREYRSVKDLNAVMENVNESVEAVAEMMKEYRNTVNQTEILLKLWKAILARAENTKATIEANVVNEGWGILYIYIKKTLDTHIFKYIRHRLQYLRNQSL